MPEKLAVADLVVGAEIVGALHFENFVHLALAVALAQAPHLKFHFPPSIRQQKEGTVRAAPQNNDVFEIEP